jgi:hypothetical protein
MGRWISKFNTTAEFAVFSATSEYSEPHVTLLKDINEVRFAEPTETRIVAKFNVTDTINPTLILSTGASLSYFSIIEVDGVELTNITNSYTFETLGEHTVKYTLTDPTSLSAAAFKSCFNMTSIVIPDSVTSIGNNAFGYCSGMTSITIGSGVTSIGDDAFQYCYSLTSVMIPNSVTYIGDRAFFQCYGLTSIDIPDSVTSIGGAVFSECDNLTSITSNAVTAPTISYNTFIGVWPGGTLYVPSGSNGYDVWMGTGNYYLGKYNWTKVEQ